MNKQKEERQKGLKKYKPVSKKPDTEQLECSCGCHSSLTSNEEMKQNGCDYCGFNHERITK